MRRCLGIASLWFVVSTASVGAAELTRIDPATTAPRTPFKLVLQGSGFGEGASVFIETANSGKFLRYRPTLFEDNRLELDLPLGFGPRPEERRLYVENRDGSRTAVLTLRITRATEVSESDSQTVDDGEEPGNASSASSGEAGPVSTEDHALPEIDELRPAAIPAGRSVIVEVFGTGFSPESKVLVTANLHAGSTRLPEYGLRAFPTYFIDGQLIEVEFDRGFYPIPGARDVVVEDESGRRSEPAVIRILQKRE